MIVVTAEDGRNQQDGPRIPQTSIHSTIRVWLLDGHARKISTVHIAGRERYELWRGCGEITDLPGTLDVKELGSSVRGTESNTAGYIWFDAGV